MIMIDDNMMLLQVVVIIIAIATYNTVKTEQLMKTGNTVTFTVNISENIYYFQQHSLEMLVNVTVLAATIFTTQFLQCQLYGELIVF